MHAEEGVAVSIPRPGGGEGRVGEGGDSVQE